MSLSIDVSVWQGFIDWLRAKAAGVDFAYIRGPIGSLWVDNNFHTNWQGAKDAGVSRRGVYCDVIRGQSAAAQALNILHQTGYDFGTEPLVLDVERTNAERDAIKAGTLVWNRAEYTAMLKALVEALSPFVRVAIYTSKNEWEAMTTSPAWAKGMVHWMAQYNNRVSSPDVPAGWEWDIWQYGQGQVDGIVHPVDMNRERVVRMQMPKVMVPKGSLAAIHAINPGHVQQAVEVAVAAGVPYSAIVQLNDAAALMGYKKASPTTWCYLRYYNPQDDSLQGLDDWAYSQRDEWCNRVLYKIYSQITAEQCRYVDWAMAWNEEDPPGMYGYKALAETFILLIQKNEFRKALGLTYVKLCLGCLAQGTPELWEIKQLVDSGLFKLMKQYGYSWNVHEGAMAWEPIDINYQGYMPSLPIHNYPGGGDVPPIPGSGLACFRFVWMFEMFLRPLGQLVPLLIGEWYPGVPGQIDRYTWYDNRLCLFEYVTGFTGYNYGPTPDWPNLEGDYQSDEMKNHRLAIRNRANGGLMSIELTDAEFADLVAHNQADAVIFAKHKPAVKHTLAGKKNSDVINLFYVAKKALGVDGWALIVKAGLESLAVPGTNRPLPYTGPAIEDMLKLSQVERDALIAAL